MKQPTFTDRLRYAFDNTLSRGPIALIAWLAVVSVVFILVMATVITVTGVANPPTEDAESGVVSLDPVPDFFEIAWRSLMRTMDAGTMGGDTGTPGYLMGMFVVTLGGVFIISILIGVLTSGIEAKLEELRKGRSFVIEQDHTLILGWTPQIFTIISELVAANTNLKKSCVVILADKDKIEMEDELRARVPRTGRTRVVCRTGSPLDPTDIEIANPHAARSIIVLAPDVDEPDTHVIKTILAITNNPQRKPGKYHIVAEIRDQKNIEVAKMVGRDEAQVVLVGDLISRITVQTCRQSGLSVIYTELLNFGGDEIYFKEEPALVGKAFGSALLAYEDSTVIGVQAKDGTVRLNPPMDTRVLAGDKIIAISADDDTIRLSGQTSLGIDETAMQSKHSAAPAPERTLILGWNHRGHSIIRELDHYVAAGSQTKVVAHVADVTKELEQNKNQTVTFLPSETTDRQTLDALDVASYDHIIVLSYSDLMDEQQADAQTLITLLHLRDMSERAGKDLAIVSEMLDVRNRELAEVTRADDFIVSDQLVSLMLSQVSENKHLNAVFADLFDPEGSEIYLKPATDYVKPGMPTNFYTIVEAARRRGEVAMGYRLKRDAHDAAKSYGVVVNPAKSKKIEFSAADKIIVIAES
ncbi:MAG: NAD-binding protein [Chloroflexi bacterium]|nr:NAD-binding protein [Chloroflexota bacterium]